MTANKLISSVNQYRPSDTGIELCIALLLYFSTWEVLRAKRNEKGMKVKPATSFKIIYNNIYW